MNRALSQDILAWDRFVRLVSLWELLSAYAHRLVEITGRFQAYAGTLGYLAEIRKQQSDPMKDPLDVINAPAMYEDIENFLKRASIICLELNLRSSVEHVQRTREEWPYIQKDVSQLAHRLKEIRQRIEDDLKGVSFLLVPLSKSEYYDHPFFGVNVEHQFPEATDDIREAGRCFATGAYSGVVLHCMGIVQVGLTVLAKTLKVKIDIQTDDWNGIITTIENAVAQKRKMILASGSKRAKSKWSKQDQFYAEVLSDIRRIKNAWRNPGFHFRRRDFDEPKAFKVLGHVKDLMVLLADNLGKKSPPEEPLLRVSL